MELITSNIICRKCFAWFNHFVL